VNYDFLQDLANKLIVLAVFGVAWWSASHGSSYGQHVIDWALGALGVLIVQRAAASVKGS
jgi:hypothetical protein